jgi:hypothetical protein
MSGKSKIIRLFTFLSLFPFFGIGQNQNHLLDNVNLPPRPRAKENFDKPGHYEMVAFLNNNEINPGDSVTIEVYFSGYGAIGGSKIYMSFSRNIFEKYKSYSLGGLGESEKGGLFWGGSTQKYDSVTSTVMVLWGIGSTKSPIWGKPTSYIDLNKDSNDLAILTEMALHKNAPFSMHLKTNDAEPGSYPITLVYTYFNGEAWMGEQQVVTIKVKNIIERNPGWAWFLGILGAIVAFVGIVPLINEFRKKFANYLSKYLASRIATPPTAANHPTVQPVATKKKKKP